VPISWRTQVSERVERHAFIVHQVVEARAAPTEAKIALRFVSHHRVHRADYFEQHHTGNTDERIPEHRADKAVGEVLA
jgi:hypothetical protein